MSKKRRIPRNMDCLLTKKERANICKRLDEIEWNTYQPWKHSTSAYADATVVEYDEDEVTFKVEWGVDGDWHDEDEFTTNRKYFNK